MSPFPVFIQHEEYPWGVLPVGIHNCTKSDFSERFVNEFPKSNTRGRICNGFMKWLENLNSQGWGLLIWIDGSFVEQKTEPEDVDAVTFADYDAINRLDPELQKKANILLNGRETTKPEFCVHSFFVPSCAKEHPYYQAFNSSRAYWIKLFGKTRERQNKTGPGLISIEKGMAKMTAGTGASPVVSEEKERLS